MNFIKSIVFIILSFFVAYLTHYIFIKFTPFLMGMGWIWLIITLLFLNGIFVAILRFVPRLISRMIRGIRSSSGFETTVICLITVAFALLSIYVGWTQGMQYGIKQIVAALGQNMMAISVYSSIYQSLTRRN